MLANLQSFWKNIYIRAILFTLGIVGIFWFLDKTQQAWVSFLIAFLVAYLINPFLISLQKRRVPRALGVLIVMLALAFFGVIVVVLLSSLLIDLASLPVSVGQSLRNIPNWLETGAPAWLQSTLNNNQEALTNFFNDTLDNVFSWFESNVNSIINQFVSGTGNFFGGLLDILVLLIFIAFTVTGYPEISKAILEIFPERHQTFAKEMGSKLDAAVGGYIRAKFIESGIMFVVSSTVLAILGVPEYLALGLVNAILNPIPYIGPLISTVIATLMALTVSWQLALVVLVVIFIIEQLDGNILAPILLSKGVDVHPVLILSSVIIGSALFGFWGVVLAIPATAFLQLLYKDYYKTSPWYTRKSVSNQPGQ